MSSVGLLNHHEHIEHGAAAFRTWVVLVMTLGFMVVEIVAGILTGSMALLADGWHMGTHAAALGITALAYFLAKRWRGDPRFAFGTGKITLLGAYSSAIVLFIVALAMGWESVHRLLNPVPILFDQALLVACIGLVVNIVSAVVLHGGGNEHHHHGHDHHHGHHHDHNLRAAYFHVLADALTSALAIVALIAGWVWGWQFLDPLMGVAGGILIAKWAIGLMKETAPRLVDRVDSSALHEAVRARLAEIGITAIEDFHLWPAGAHAHAALVRVRTDRSGDEVHQALNGLHLDHLTVETVPLEVGDD